MPESRFARWWKLVALPAAPVGPKRRKLTPKQKRLLIGAAIFFLLAGTGTATYFYIAGAPDRAENQFQLATKSMRPGHYQEALAELTRSINTYPLAKAYVERGFAHRYLNQRELAAADLEKAADLDPENARAFSGLGSIYRERGDLKRALEQYTKSIQISSNMDALFERGQVYESLGEHQKAIDDFSSAIAIMRDSPFIYLARATAELNLGQTEQAEQDRQYAQSIEASH